MLHTTQAMPPPEPNPIDPPHDSGSGGTRRLDRLAAAMEAFLTRLKADGTPAAFVDDLIAFDAFNDAIGLPEIAELEQRFPD